MSRTTRTSSPDTEDYFDYEVIEEGEVEGLQLAANQAPDENPRQRLALIGAFVMLAVVLGAIIWLLLAKSPTSGTVGTSGSQNAYPISTVSIGGLDVGPKVGSLAPDFELTDINTGKPVKLSSLRGKPVWLNYFATWCPPCKAELPDMKREYAKYKDKGLVVVGIDMREDPAQVKGFTSSNGYNWTFVIDTDGQVTDRYFVYSIPTHLFIGEDGVIKSVGIGALTPNAMETNISKIIGQ